MYAITHAIYGITLPEKLQTEIELKTDIIDEIGITHYSGHSGNSPFAIGIEVTSFEEGYNLDIEYELLREFDKRNLIEEYKHIKEKTINDIKEYIAECNDEENFIEDILNELIEYIRNNDPRKILIWSTS